MPEHAKLGRNSPCFCGSGKKYKACCLGVKSAEQVVIEKSRTMISIMIVIAGCVGGVFAGMSKGWSYTAALIAASVIVAVGVWVFRDPNPPRGGSGDSSAINFGN